MIENGVNADAFNPTVRPAVVDGLGSGPVVGFVGGLKNWHGIQNLLHGFRKVLSEIPDARLLVVGDGPKRGWIHGFVEGADIEEHVHLTGWMEHDKLPELVARMDVVVAPYPASEEFYFSPLKLFEYMASGKPVVASRIGQICDVIEDGQSGWLVEPGDTEELADAIVRLIKDPVSRQTLGSLARRLAVGRSWLANAQRVLDLDRNPLSKVA